MNPAAMLLPAANVIMQLAVPGVGYGVLESPVDSGNVYKHPFKRARTTGTYLAVATIGTESDRALIRGAVDVAHRRVDLQPIKRALPVLVERDPVRRPHPLRHLQRGP